MAVKGKKVNIVWIIIISITVWTIKTHFKNGLNQLLLVQLKFNGITHCNF